MYFHAVEAVVVDWPFRFDIYLCIWYTIYATAKEGGIFRLDLNLSFELA